MAESLKIEKTIDAGSDNLPEQYCEPCYEVDGNAKPVAGYCIDCCDNLCQECITVHLRPKPFRNHNLVDNSAIPKAQSTKQSKTKKLEEKCLLHYDEMLRLFCLSHSQFCCKVCLTMDHQACTTEEISKLAINIQDSEELTTLVKKLITLKNGFKINISRTGTNKSVIQKNYNQAVEKIAKLRDEFDKLMTETETEAEKVKAEDLTKIEKVAATCDIVIHQIDKLRSNLETLKQQSETERLFVSMKRAESLIQSLEGNLDQLDKDNTAREYKFEPDKKLSVIMKEINVLGQISFIEQSNASVPTSQKINISDQKEKMPVFLKDITTASSSEISHIYCSTVLSNDTVLITDEVYRKVKLIDIKQDKVISEVEVPGRPFGITKLKMDGAIVTLPEEHKLQFISVSQDTLSKGKIVSVDGRCYGIAYNDKDQTIVVSYVDPAKVEILNMTGNVIKRLGKDSKGQKLFYWPANLTLSTDRMEIYVSDQDEGMESVKLINMTGDIKAKYTHWCCNAPRALHVHESGLVYVIGRYSHTLHQLDPITGEFKQLLGLEDGLDKPLSISFCDAEDKMYIGMHYNAVLKVFQMK